MGALYVVVEGRRTEPALYRAWLPLLLPRYKPVKRVEDACEETYFVVAGEGYPSYKRRVRAAVKDVTASGSRFTHLMVCVDSEELTCEQRQRELEALVEAEECAVPTRFIVANCCIETWQLGNRKVVSRSPESAELRGLLGLYDIVSQDPERMQNLDVRFRTRAQFHGHYLKHVFAARGINYSKRSPGAASSPAFFEQLRLRTGSLTDGSPDLASFARLLELPRWIEATAAR